MTMQFTLTGFKQDLGFRVFTFERVAADRSRTPCSIRADLSLVRAYGIRVQELPALCRDFLLQHDPGVQLLAATFTEDDMRHHADHLTAARLAAAERRRPMRRTPGNNAGAAWRAPERFTEESRTIGLKPPSET
jgi:hypothetical protein